MPAFNVTLEDTSPLLRYSANWKAGTDDQDSENSMMLTESQAETLEIDFYGSSITLFGPMMANHGLFQGQLDGGPVFTGNGSGPDASQQALYTANSTTGSHSMKLTNGENKFFGIDYVTFQTSVGRDDEDLIVNSYQDSHPSFVYIPNSLWYTTGDKVSWFSGSNGHFTNESSAVVKFTFQGEYIEIEKQQHGLANVCRPGDAVAMYGAVGPQGGDYTVQIDNNPKATYSGKKTFFRPKEVIFYAGNLGDGNHSLQLQLSSSSLAELSIDYADVYTSSSLGGSFLGSTSPNIIIDNVAKTPTGIIAALVVTSTCALITTLTLMYVFWRQRRDASSRKTIPAAYNSTKGPHNASVPLPVINHAADSTTTAIDTAGISHPSAADSSIRGFTSSSASSHTAGAHSMSRYLPQGKRNAALVNAYGGMTRSDTDTGGVDTREGTNTDMYPPQYSEG